MLIYINGITVSVLSYPQLILKAQNIDASLDAGCFQYIIVATWVQCESIFYQTIC